MRAVLSALVGIAIVTLPASAQFLAPELVDSRIRPPRLAVLQSVQIQQDNSCEERRRIGRIVGGVIGAAAMATILAVDSVSHQPLLYAWTGAWGGLFGMAVGTTVASPPCSPRRPRTDPNGCVPNAVRDAKYGALGGGVAGFLVSPVLVAPVFIFDRDNPTLLARVVGTGTIVGATAGATLNLIDRRQRCRA